MLWTQAANWEQKPELPCWAPWAAIGAVIGLSTLPTILYPQLALKVIPQAVRGSAKHGYQLGTEIGSGELVSAMAGMLTATVVSTPQGVTKSVENFNAVASGTKTFKRLAGKVWQDGQQSGGVASYCAGGSLGGLVGGAVGLLATGADVLVDGARGAVEWGQKGYQ